MGKTDGRIERIRPVLGREYLVLSEEGVPNLGPDHRLVVIRLDVSLRRSTESREREGSESENEREVRDG
jgi:hypothetical protein